MTRIFRDSDADPAEIDGASIAVVGYGNQGRSWALNLRDSGLAPRVCVRADASREQARADGFEAQDIEAASDADVVVHAPLPSLVFGDVPEQDLDDICKLLAAGKNVITVVGYLHPKVHGPRVVDRLHRPLFTAG